METAEKMINHISIFGFKTTLYDVSFVIGFIAVLLYLFWHRKDYDMPAWKIIVYDILVYGSAYAWMFFLYWADTGFTHFGGNNVVRVFWWLGVFSVITSLILRKNVWKCLDMVSPCLCINHGIAHFGCIFAGCCYGYPTSWGLWSNNADHRCFPNQPIEAIFALVIVFIIWRREKNKGFGKGSDGLSYPIMLMLFGYSRFFFEFLRDNDKLFYITKSITWGGKPVFGISQLAVHALVNAVIGTVSYFIIKNLGKKGKLNFEDPKKKQTEITE